MNTHNTIIGYLIIALLYSGSIQANEEAEVFRSLYSASIKRALETPDREDDLNLADTMLAAAKESIGTPTMLSLMCTHVYKLTSTNPAGYEKAADAMELLARHVPKQSVEALEKETSLRQRLYAGSRGDARQKAGSALVDVLVRFAIAKQDIGDTRVAISSWRRAQQIAKQIGSDRMSELEAGFKNALSLRRTGDRITELRKTLENHPNDQKTARLLVEVIVIELDRPSSAIQYSLQTADKEFNRLVMLATSDITSISKIDSLALGDWYRSLSAKTTQPKSKSAMFSRAKAYYERFINLNDANDLFTKKAQLAVKGIDASLAKLESAGVETDSRSAMGKRITNSVGMKFMYIKPGSFLMGSPSDEDGRNADEVRHPVKITKGYYMGAITVTQAQWKAVVGTTPWSGFSTNVRGDSDEFPAVGITWVDAVAFCKKLSNKEKRKYRLPTEAEWEYACRAGSAGPFGVKGEPSTFGWFAENSDNKLHRGGKKKPNAWGLYDMHGNLFEWCSDYNGSYPTVPVIDPKGSKSGDRRIIRGGTWALPPVHCRSAIRRGDSESRRDYHLAIRVVLELK